MNDKQRSIDITDNQVKSTLLVNDNKELIIEHNEDLYRLRITGNDKLILTK